MSLHIPKKVNESDKPPVWYPWRGHIMLTCSSGHTAPLDDHEIAADGTVTPSTECAYAACTFHEHVILDGFADRHE